MSRAAYDEVRRVILDLLEAHGEVRLADLPIYVGTRLPEEFSGRFVWSTRAVRLDLEARGEIVHGESGRFEVVRRVAAN